jgi:hypothetical protein
MQHIDEETFTIFKEKLASCAAIHDGDLQRWAKLSNKNLAVPFAMFKASSSWVCFSIL